MGLQRAEDVRVHLQDLLRLRLGRWRLRDRRRLQRVDLLGALDLPVTSGRHGHANQCAPQRSIERGLVIRDGEPLCTRNARGSAAFVGHGVHTVVTCDVSVSLITTTATRTPRARSAATA